MIGLKVLIYVESRYQVNRKRIKQAVATVLAEQQMSERLTEVSVAVVGDRKMRTLHKKYKGEEKTTNVLSFPIAEGAPMIFPDDKILHLGDIIISYPQVIREASKEDMLVDDKIDELVKHSMLHLLGMHHQ